MNKKMYIVACAANDEDDIYLSAHADERNAKMDLQNYYHEVVDGMGGRIESRSKDQTDFSVLFRNGAHYYGEIQEIEVPGVEYPELDVYDEEHQYDFNRDDEGDLLLTMYNVDLADLGRYEVVFEANGERYYAYFDAVNSNEALGQFFRLHPHICMSDVIEILEV